MKTEEFINCPKWDDCFTEVYPAEFKIGSIFSNEGPKLPEEQKWQEVRVVTKIEPLKDHAGYIAITSILIGFIRSYWISEEKIVKKSWLFGNTIEYHNRRLVVTDYYDEDNLNRKKCLYYEGKNREKVEVFFSFDLKKKYYIPNIEKIKHLKAPIEDGGTYYIEYHSLEY